MEARNQIARNTRANTAATLRENQDQQARRAWEMRRRGKSWYQIAETMKIPEAQASRLVADAIKAAASMVSAATRQELLALEVARLDEMMNAIYDDALAGDLAAAREVRANVMDRAKLLNLYEAEQTHGSRAVIIPGTLHTDDYVTALRMIADGSAGADTPNVSGG